MIAKAKLGHYRIERRTEDGTHAVDVMAVERSVRLTMIGTTCMRLTPEDARKIAHGLITSADCATGYLNVELPWV